MREGLSPQGIQALGSAFRASRLLFSAVELAVFTELAGGPLDVGILAASSGIHPRGARDFFDSLVALNLLERHGDLYANTPESDFFLDRAKPSYIGGMAEMQAVGGWRMWGTLTEALRTGRPQTEAKGDYETLYQNEVRARKYLQAMTGASLMAAQAVAGKFPWGRYSTFVDIGTAQGCVPVQLALAHEHLNGGGLDLPSVRPLFDEYVASFSLAHRIRFHAGDFSTDELPVADVIILGNIISDLSMRAKTSLLQKAFRAAPDGGAVIVYEPLIDDDRINNSSALLASVGLLLNTEEGFGFTGAECQKWMRDIGFADTWVEHLDGPRSMVIGVK